MRALKRDRLYLRRRPAVEPLAQLRPRRDLHLLARAFRTAALADRIHEARQCRSTRSRRGMRVHLTAIPDGIAFLPCATIALHKRARRREVQSLGEEWLPIDAAAGLDHLSTPRCDTCTRHRRRRRFIKWRR